MEDKCYYDNKRGIFERQCQRLKDEVPNRVAATRGVMIIDEIFITDNRDCVVMISRGRRLILKHCPFCGSRISPQDIDKYDYLSKLTMEELVRRTLEVYIK